MLQNILVIAKNAFREAIRDRILYNLILFVLIITASAIFLGELSGGQEARVIVNLGLSSIPADRASTAGVSVAGRYEPVG